MDKKNITKFIEKVDETKIKAIKKKLVEKTPKVWDPVQDLDINTINKNIKNIEINLEQQINDFQKIKNQSIIAIFICLLILYFISAIIAIIAILVINLIIASFSFQKKYVILKKDLIKLEIAKKKGWIYDPLPNEEKYLDLLHYFPEIFDIDTQFNYKYVEDQFWGITNINNSKHYFYQGLFHYEIIPEGDGIKITVPFNSHYFMFPLKKKINCRFSMYPKNGYNEKKINLESNNFNKIFDFNYNGEKEEKVQEIVKTLTPAIQEKLIELYYEKGEYEILFTRHTVIFLFKDDIVKKIKTDSKKNTEIDKEDLNEVDGKLEKLILISEEMSKYLD